MKRNLVSILVASLLIAAALLLSSHYAKPVQAQVVPWPTGPYAARAISFAGSGNNTILAASSGQAWCVYGLFFVAGGATSITIQDGAATGLSGAMSFAANGSMFLPLSGNPKMPWFVTSLGNAFVINSSNAVQVSGSVYAQVCP